MSGATPGQREAGSPWGVVARISVLTGIWVLLWGTLSFANVLSGAIVSILVLWLFPIPSPEDTRIRPLAALRFAVVFAWLLVVSTWETAVEILRRRPAQHQAIVAVPLRTESAVIATIVGNAISLTPGTLTVDVRPDPMVLYVHGLRVEDAEGVRATARRLEDLALATFGMSVPDGAPPLRTNEEGQEHP
jgi:multicomponent Na+:H+ antiporter subunit E